MNQQPNSHQGVNFDGAASVEGQVGQVGRDLIQNVTRDDLVERPFRNIEIFPQELFLEDKNLYNTRHTCMDYLGSLPPGIFPKSLAVTQNG